MATAIASSTLCHSNEMSHAYSVSSSPTSGCGTTLPKSEHSGRAMKASLEKDKTARSYQPEREKKDIG